MADISFPRDKTDVASHMQFLLDAMRHVAETPAPEKYTQIPHGEGSVIGDIHKPAVLNASYPYFNSYLVSISMPTHVSFQKDYEVVDAGKYQIKQNDGLTKANMSDSFFRVLREQGIRMDLDDAKIGKDRLSNTYYIETRVNPEDYPRAKAIVDVMTRGRDLTATQVLEQIKSVDKNGRIHSPHYTGPNIDENGKPIVSNGTKPSSAGQTAPQKPSAPKDHYITLAQAEITHTSKGIYLGVGKTDSDIAKITDALKQSGFKDSDFKVRHSNAFGGNVIEMSGEAGTRFMTGQAKLRESGVHLETPQAHTPVNQPAAQPVAPPKPPPVAAPVDLDLSQPAQPKPAAPSAAPAQPSQTAKPSAPAAAAAVAGVDIDIGKPAVTPTSAMADASTRAREQLANLGETGSSKRTPPPSSAKVDIDVTNPTAGPGQATRAQVVSNAGGKFDNKLGKAETAIQAGAKLAEGDVAGAALTAVQGVATDMGVKKGAAFLAKRIPGIGAVVTLGMTLWSAGAEAAQGNYKKAGAELLAGGAEAAGNIVGFGAGDVAREIARGGIIAAGGPAAEKSQARQMGENIISAGKTVVDKAKFGSMDQKTLASTIASDPALHKTVNRGGVATPLADALKDKDFRNQYVKTLQEQTASGQYDRSTQIATIKAYGEKVDASAPAQASATPAKPAAVAQAAAPAASAQQVAQYKAMGTAELGRTIQKDDVLPDKVKIGGKEMDLADALKDKSFRQEMLKNMESAQAKGTDMSTQIAMVKAYGDKIEIEQRRPTVTASAPAPSITAPMA